MLKRTKKFWTRMNDFEVYLVDGAYVRLHDDMDFNWGGHHLRYSWIPKKEIWIENLGPEQERKFVLLHELHEWKLMDNGMDYDEAHEASNKVEKRARKNPQLLEHLLEIENHED